MSATRIDPPFEVRTPKGYGLAHFVELGCWEMNIYWGVVQSDGQFWMWPNDKVRFHKNHTLYRDNPEVPPLDPTFEKYKLKPNED